MTAFQHMPRQQAGEREDSERSQYLDPVNRRALRFNCRSMTSSDRRMQYPCIKQHAHQRRDCH
ncbi:hypothetical protein C8Q76DRAFT_737121 [Earliella scabrosa]|nr:hypothetical protein C8Q76DRAFT_737121 [Earliella scabrosa]